MWKLLAKQNNLSGSGIPSQIKEKGFLYIEAMKDLMEKLTSLCKRRGFIFPGSEIYGGFGGFYDYGPLGVELKNNLKREWWKSMVYNRDDVVGIDAAIIMNPDVWKASGHVDHFTDPLVECKNCHRRFRADKVGEVCPECSGKLTKPKNFNILVETYVGVVEGAKRKTYLRGEITQGVHVNFTNILNSTRMKLPFGVAQIGKAFRNEITPGNFTYRMREFEQMELQYYIKSNTKEGEQWFAYWKEARLRWYLRLGIREANLRFRDHEPAERAHYARAATDIEYNAPFGWSEFEGIHDRGDWDLSQHSKFSGRDLSYFDQATNERIAPWVIETSGGVDRATLFFLLDAYHEEEKRTVLKLHPRLSPIKVAVFPLVANKEELVKKARSIYKELKATHLIVAWDDRGNIGKRYLSQDEAGTPWCVTIDYDTVNDGTVTIRDRDTTKQVRIKAEKLAEYIGEKLN